jgi:halocyanin-like protein
MTERTAEAVSRRGVLAGSVGLLVSVAGCTGGDDTDTEEQTDSPSPTDTPDDSGGVPEDVQEYLAEEANFEGSLADETGSEAVAIDVGAEGNDGNFAFRPPAVRISSGTRVTWEWTGEGGQHNVVHEGGDFESELASSGDTTYERTFDSTGTWLYFCRPHKSLEMKGAVVVE